ncbi:MAG: helix-turn-helix domain-containing protein [Armatimonadetes bacterium]|nr:helix-turn-helix domain-containing protein [Armatimonadota bacterium]
MHAAATMTISELGTKLGISRDKVYTLLREGRIPARRMGKDLPGARGGKWLILRAEVCAWLEAGCPGLSEPTAAALALYEPTAAARLLAEEPKAA